MNPNLAIATVSTKTDDNSDYSEGKAVDNMLFEDANVLDKTFKG